MTIELSIILFVITSMIVLMLARELNKRFNIPITPILMILGFIFGLSENLGYISSTYNIIEKLNPNEVSFIYIPILVFYTNFNSHIEML